MKYQRRKSYRTIHLWIWSTIYVEPRITARRLHNCRWEHVEEMLQMTNDRNPLHHDFSVDSVRFRLSALCLVLHLHNEVMSLTSYFLASLASLALHIKLKWRNENMYKTHICGTNGFRIRRVGWDLPVATINFAFYFVLGKCFPVGIFPCQTSG